MSSASRTRFQHAGFCALLVSLLASFSTLPLFRPYLFASHDGLLHLYRLMEYDRAIRDGVLYPRWAPDFLFGYGYPVFNYYAPLTYYFAEIFRLLGAGYIDSLKLLVAVAMALSGLTAYLYARCFLSPVASTLAAVAYMYAPYHIVNLYYRGAIAEYLAFIWFPLILWSLRKALQTRQLIHMAVASVFYGALILTHNLSALIFSGFLILYCLALLWQTWAQQPMRWKDAVYDVLRLAGAISLGAALSAFFWLPAMAEGSLVHLDRLLLYDFHKYFPRLEQLLSTSLIHDYGVTFWKSYTFHYKLGLLQTLFLLLATAVLLWRWRLLKFQLRVEAAVSLLITAFSFLLILPASQWVWENAPLLNLIQFPWRFLTFVALPGILLSGLVVEALSERLRWPLAAAFVALVIFSSSAGMSPIMSNIKEEHISPAGSIEYELTYGAIGTSAGAEYDPRWLGKPPAASPTLLWALLNGSPPPAVLNVPPGLEARLLEKKANRTVYVTTGPTAGAVELATLYFPGWQAYIDDARVDIGADGKSGLIKLDVPAGEHLLRLEFAETPPRLIGDYVSALAFITLLLLLLPGLKRWQFISHARPKLRFSRAAMIKTAIVLAFLPVWLASKALYDAAYAPAQLHQYPLVINVEDHVMIEGFDLLGAETFNGWASKAFAGSTLNVDVSWRPLDPKARLDVSPAWYRPFARLSNIIGRTWAYYESPSYYPEANWKQGSTISTILPLEVPEATPPGAYQIEVGFYSVAADQRLDMASSNVATMPGGRPPREGKLQLARVHPVPSVTGARGGRIAPILLDKTKNDRRTSPPSGSSLLSAPVNFQQTIRLLDYAVVDDDAPGSHRPGKPLTVAGQPKTWARRAGEAVHLNLLWQAAQPVKSNLMVTARLADGRSLWAIRDSQPGDGTYPMSLWDKDEIVRDQLTLHIAAETPPGNYTLELEVVSRTGPLSILDEGGTPVGPTVRLGNIIVAPPVLPAKATDLTMQRRLLQPLGDAVSLLGYTLGRAEALAGQTVHLELYWLAIAPPRADLRLQLELWDQRGQRWSQTSGKPIGEAYPTTLWKLGDIWRGQYDLVLPAAVSEGQGQIVLRLTEANTGTEVASVILDEIRVLSRARTFAATPSNTLAQDFEGKSRLLGYDLSVGQEKTSARTPVIVPPQKMGVTLYWQAMGEMQTSYTVFAQLLDSSGKLVSQHDGIPRMGESPTTGWLVDEVIADTHPVNIPENLPDGVYTLIAGLYDTRTGRRLGTGPGKDFVPLTQIRISREDGSIR